MEYSTPIAEEINPSLFWKIRQVLCGFLVSLSTVSMIDISAIRYVPANYVYLEHTALRG